MKRFKKAILALLMVMACSLCAIFVACKPTVTFSVDGGEALEAVQVESGTDYKLPVPQKEGFRFEGWYLSEDFSGTAVESIKVEEDVTVYAKWTELFTVTLDANGGELSTLSFELAAGEKVFDSLAGLTPTKAGNKFDSWYHNKTQLTTSYAMPAEDITLTAKYKVAYTVEVYKQNATLDGYDAPEVTTEYDFAGKTVSPEKTVVGFEETTTADSVYSVTLSEDPAQNVIKLYFNREVYNVSFNTNYPVEDAENTVETLSVTYGNSVNVPNDLTFEGYVLAGWSTTPDGKIEYLSNYIANVVYKATERLDGEAFSPQRHTVLYAVWQKGYVDMFGASDIIFLIGDQIYLNRGGVFFAGSYKAEDKSFEFEISETNILTGNFLTDEFYCYYDEERAVFTAYQFDYIPQDVNGKEVFGGKIFEENYILLDGYNGIEMFLTGEDGTTLTIKRGSYLIEDGIFHATFTELDGEPYSEQVDFTVGTTTSGKNVYILCNQEEIDLGTLTRVAIYNGELVSFKPEYYSFTFDGYYTANYQVGDQTQSFLYHTDGNKLYIYSSGSYGYQLQLEARIVEFNGAMSYVIYDAQYDLDITATDGATLVADGLYKATYTKGETVISGYFEQNMTKSFAGGNIFTIIQADGTTVRLLVKETDVTPDDSGSVGGEEGEPVEPVYEYEIKQLPQGYTEYCFFDGKSAYFRFYIILDEEVAGTANFYAYSTETDAIVKVATGAYAYSEATGLYTYTISEHFDVAADTEPIDVSTMAVIVFGVDNLTFSSGAAYDVMYLHSYTANDVDSTQTDLTTLYTSTNYDEDGATITMVSVFATITIGNNSVTGTYEIGESDMSATGYLLAISFADGTTLYAEIDQEAKTFTLFTHNVYSAYRLNADGSINQKETLSYDGKGGATYVDADGVTHVGKFEETTYTSKIEAPVMRFVSETATFYYFELQTEQAIFFTVWTEDAAKEYTSEEDGDLYIDGCGAYMEYTDALGNTYTGMYTMPEENVIYALLGGQVYVYFDIDGESFTLRGFEYGTYILMDNQHTDGILIELDGYETIKLYTVGEDENGESIENVIDTTTYTLDGSKITFTYTDGAEEITIVGVVGYYTAGSNRYNAIFIEHLETVATYVTPDDWSVLVLDSLGNAKRYDTAGNLEYGTAMLITDTMLYYVNSAATNAGIYRYDVTTGEARLVNFPSRSYYTSNFESLVFTEYGFAIFDGTTRYYYDMDDDGNVTIYTYDKNHQDANEYGYVEKAFGQFDSTKQYDDKEYYITNGYSLFFKRDAATAEKYPYKTTDNNGNEQSLAITNLTFTPSGSAEMNGIQGTITIGENNYTCYIYRTLLEDGSYESYIRVGSIYLGVTLTYLGEDEITTESRSIYSITSMKMEVSYNDDGYNSLLYYASMFGIPVANTYGTISILESFDENGVGQGRGMTISFGADAKMTDMLGNTVFTLETTEYNEVGNNVIAVPFEKDGYKHCLYFALVTNSYTGDLGYQVIAITNIQTVTVGEYVFEIQEVIASSTASNVGRVYSVKLTKGEGETAVEVEYDHAYILKDGTVVLYVYSYKEGTSVINGGTYYEIRLTAKEYTEEETAPVGNVYTSATITPHEMSVYYTEDGTAYVLMVNDRVVYYYTSANAGIAVDCVYDAETQTYTFSAFNKKYSMTIVEGKAQINEVVESDNA